MNPNIQTYRSLIFIIGVLGALFITAYQSSISVMYPNGGDSFNQMFYGAAAIFLILGIAIPLKSLKGTLSTLSVGALIFLSIATIVAGLTYAYDIRTEEFLIYFLLNAISTLVFVAGAALLIKFILLKAGLTQKEVFQSIAMGVIGLVIGFVAYYFAGSIQAIYFWYGISTLLIVTFYLTRKEITVNPKPGY